jgi:NAD(P)-dependent dehydrogenase (short-subunit alcohol dehydrogenase family)
VIVNISSVAANLGSPGEYVWYAASKGAIDALTTGLSKELASDGIRVNAVSPGLIETEIHALSTGDPTRLERLTPMIPLERAGTAEEVARAVLFLLWPEASYITGANLRISGGR